ncbi:PID-CTERM protein-sorting domain-containing protein [Polaribacter aquimarinus]|uniref:PID-CTERM protein-sorting domain-containing protein n=2 Tax=Polaribacter TaxID=52959 RepID=UPI0011B21C7B|nr:hypothetical protein [Polaribacter aquimarinus]
MFKRIIIIGVIIMFPLMGLSQVVPPPVPPPPPPGLPIDGITGMLFLVGIIYGSKKILKDSSS